jgi:hypothetical protein
MADLQLSAYLQQAAHDEDAGFAYAGYDAGSRQRHAAGQLTEELLERILGRSESQERAAEADAIASPDLSTARARLQNSMCSALDLITSRASTTGQLALTGLVGMGVAELMQAITVVGAVADEALGLSVELADLEQLVRGYVANAIVSLVALLGLPLLAAVAGQAVEWLRDLGEGRLLTPAVVKLYQTQGTLDDLSAKVRDSEAALGRLDAAREAIDALDSAYGRQTTLVAMLLKGLRLVSALPVVVLPAGPPLVAGANLSLGIYVILAGGDFVDSRHSLVPNRVPGVRVVVEKWLAG